MIAGTIEIQMMADLARLRTDMDEARSVVSGASTKIDGILDTLKRSFGALTAAIGIREIIGFADAATELQNKLRLVSMSTDDASTAYSRLFSIAQQSRVSFIELGSTYAAIARAGNEMGVSQDRLLTITQAIGNAMTISGGSASSMQAALVQLGQGMSSGTLRSEELNSVMEQTPRLAKAIADGLGVTISELRELGKAGELTAEQVMAALERSAPQLAREMSGSVMTVSQSFETLKNTAVRFTGETNTATGATGALSQAIAGIRAPFDVASEAMERGRQSGQLWWQVLNEGVGAFLGRSLQLNLINREFMTLDDRIRDATATIAALDAKAAKGELFFYGMAERAKAVRELKAAQDELTNSSKVQSTVEQAMEIQGKARERVEKRLRASADELSEIRGKLAGVDKNYLDMLGKLQKARDDGMIGEAEYIRLVSDLAEKNYKVSESDKAREKSLKDATREQERATEAYARLIERARDSIQKTAEEVGAVEKLTTAQQFVIGVSKEVKDGKIQLTDARAREITQIVAEMDATDRLRPSKAAELELARQRNAEFDVAFDKMERERLANEGQIKAARTYLERLEFETAALKMTTEERAVANAVRDLERQGVVAGTDAYNAYIEKVRLAVVDKSSTEASIAEMKKVEEASANTAKAIEDGLVGSLFRAFESGKNFWSTLWSGIVNTFKTTILTPIIKDTVKDFIGWFKTGAKLVDSTVMTPTFSTSGIGTFLNAFATGIQSLLSWFDSAFGGVLSNIWNGIGSLVSSVFGGGGSGSTGLIGSAANAATGGALNGWMSSAGSAVSGWLSNTAIGATASAPMNAALIESALAGSGAAAGTGTGLGSSIANWLGLSNTGAGAAAGGGSAAGGAGAAGAGIGAAGAAALGGVALMALNVWQMSQKDDSIRDRGGEYFVDRSGLQVVLGTGKEGELAGPEIQAAIANSAGSINALLAAVGSSTRLESFQAGLRDAGLEALPTGGVYAGGRLSSGATFGEARSAVGTVYADPNAMYEQVFGESGYGDMLTGYAGNDLYERTSAQDVDGQQALINLGLDLMQAQIQALQAVGDLPAEIVALLSGVDAEALDATGATGVLNNIGEIIAGNRGDVGQVTPSMPAATSGAATNEALDRLTAQIAALRADAARSAVAAERVEVFWRGITDDGTSLNVRTVEEPT